MASAVRDYIEEWSRMNGIEHIVRVQGERSLPLEVEHAVFRILQEALSNIARHSKANNVEVKMKFSKSEFSCSIKDDGIGFDITQKQIGFGLRSMRERADSLDGHLSVESSPGEGTCIEIYFPTHLTKPGNEEKSDE